jgi:hypothetical protein
MLGSKEVFVYSVAEEWSFADKSISPLLGLRGYRYGIEIMTE